MRVNRSLAAAAALFLAGLPARADQILGAGRIVSGTNAVVLPGGPTLGLWSGGKYTSTPDAIQIKGSGSTGDVSGMSVTPDAGAPVGTLANLSATKANGASPAFTGSGSWIEGMTASPSASHAGLTFQNTATTAASILGPQQPPGWFTVDGIRSAYVVKSDATATTTSAFGFYVRNEAPESVTGATGMFGTVACVVANSACWGQNPTVIDAPQNGVVTNLQGIKLIGSEYDIQVTSPFTTVQGISVIGSSVSQPSYADGVTVGHLSAQSPGLTKWMHAFLSSDGAANVGVLIGAASVSGTSVGGTPNLLNYFDSSGVARAVRYRSMSDGSFFVDGVSAPNGVSALPAVAGQYPTLRATGTDANVGLVLQGQGAGQVITQSLLNAAQGIYISGNVTEASSFTPASSSAACTPGQHAWDANYEYRCVAANTWKRAALSAF